MPNPASPWTKPRPSFPQVRPERTGEFTPPTGRRPSRRALLFVWITFFCLGSAGFCFAQDSISDLESKLKANPNDETALMELGRIYHDQAAEGDEGALDKAFECFNKVLAIDSLNAVALAYRGSLWTYRALDAWWPPSKLGYLRKSGQDLDKAVAMEPYNMMVRLLRGINSLSLPGRYGRLAVALEDFIVLLRHPDFAAQTPQLKATIYYYGGVAYKRADDWDTARQLLQKAISILPGSEFAKRAQKELDDMDS
jgi:tetratricopeptide (TPR) repeat protein